MLRISAQTDPWAYKVYWADWSAPSETGREVESLVQHSLPLILKCCSPQILQNSIIQRGFVAMTTRGPISSWISWALTSTQMDHRLSGIASWPPSILQKINATQERRCRPESDRRLAINDGCACLAKQRDKPSRPVPANTPRRTGLIYCWSSIVDSGPTLSQHLFNVVVCWVPITIPTLSASTISYIAQKNAIPPSLGLPWFKALMTRVKLLLQEYSQLYTSRKRWKKLGCLQTIMYPSKTSEWDIYRPGLLNVLRPKRQQ